MLLPILLTTVACIAPLDREPAKAKSQGPEGGVAGATCTCVGDLDSSGAIDAADLSVLLGQWGIYGSADLNGDFIVNAADLSIMLGAWGPCSGAPANDHCANAAPASNGTNYFCTFGADTDGPQLMSCVSSGFYQINADVWFDYVAPGDGTITVSTCNIGWDTKLAIYGSTCPTDGSSLTCSDDAPGCVGGSVATIDVLTNQHYTIRVGGYANMQGSGILDIGYEPAGVDCEHAIVVLDPINKTVLGTTADKSVGPDEPNCAVNDTYSTWYVFEAPCNLSGADMTVSTCNPGTEYDTVLTVWKNGPLGECAATLVDCNDDSELVGCQLFGNNRKSRVSFQTDPGWFYYVQVSGYQGQAGDYELTITMDACP